MKKEYVAIVDRYPQPDIIEIESKRKSDTEFLYIKKLIKRDNQYIVILNDEEIFNSESTSKARKFYDKLKG